MLKYTDTKVTFSEVPDEITLCINISNCPFKCKGCHSPYLRENKGTILNLEELEKLIKKNKGITCVAFMGGDSEPLLVDACVKYVKIIDKKLKTAWYSGNQEIHPDIDLWNFTYIKLGPYIEELGPITSKTTNQRMYFIRKCYDIDGDKMSRGIIKEDITHEFWKDGK